MVDVQGTAVIDFWEASQEDNVVPKRLTHRQIADDLDARIRAGEYPPGTHIPSYRRIAELYSVSISTASKAVGLLTDRGLVEEDPGRGVLVRECEREDETP